jgi:hypothetical protein
MLEIPKKELAKHYDAQDSQVSRFADIAYTIWGAAVIRCVTLWQERYGSRGWNPQKLDCMSDAEILEKNSDIFFEAYVCDQAKEAIWSFAMYENIEFRRHLDVLRDLAWSYKKRKQAVECKTAKDTLKKYGIVVK